MHLTVSGTTRTAWKAISSLPWRPADKMIAVRAIAAGASSRIPKQELALISQRT